MLQSNSLVLVLLLNTHKFVFVRLLNIGDRVTQAFSFKNDITEAADFGQTWSDMYILIVQYTYRLQDMFQAIAPYTYTTVPRNGLFISSFDGLISVI